MNKKSIFGTGLCVLLLSLLISCGGGGGTTPSSANEEPPGGGEIETRTTHEDPDDYLIDGTDIVHIQLNHTTITVTGGGAEINGTVVTITAGGEYQISGTLDDGRIIVDSDDDETVKLILNGVDIQSTTNSPLSILKAEKTVLFLEDSTNNTLTDPATYVFDDPDDDEPNAAIFSKDDLTLCGGGSLTIHGNYNNGISVKDGLIIAGGTITVTAEDDGIRGKDYLVIKEGNLTITAGNDGLKSDNDDPLTGFIEVHSGTYNIIAEGDGVQAEADITIDDGTFTILSGGGSTVAPDASAKGLKAGTDITINSGTFDLDGSDDTLNANNDITINDGSFTLSTGDDAIHADAHLTVVSGTIHILKCFEGLESEVVTINGGDIHIMADDDGINAAEMDNHLYINGGYIAIDAYGDGIDINGDIEMTGGTVIVHGPVADLELSVDYDASFVINGGVYIGSCVVGPAHLPSLSWPQNTILLDLGAILPAGTLVHIQDSGSDNILTFSPAKAFRSILFSSPDLITGERYSVFLGGTSSGTPVDGVTSDGTYFPGTFFIQFTIYESITTVKKVF